MLRTYYLLTKPGIIIGNLITTVAGFILASQGSINFKLFLATFTGLGCVIASACVFNNYIDRESDKKMTRTQNRPLAKGLISEKKALFFAIVLGFIGLVVLARFTNLLAVLVTVVAFVIYVALYSFWKHRTSYATLIGSISGAMPPVVGYCAASNQFDLGAATLFCILVLWQMPHFYSIALYRLEDYRAASIPVLPVKDGNQKTKIHMTFYIIAFIVVSLMLMVLDYTGYLYFFTVLILGISWLLLCLKGFKTANEYQWARQMFRLSLIIITAMCGIICIYS